MSLTGQDGPATGPGPCWRSGDEYPGHAGSYMGSGSIGSRQGAPLVLTSRAPATASSVFAVARSTTAVRAPVAGSNASAVRPPGDETSRPPI